MGGQPGQARLSLLRTAKLRIRGNGSPSQRGRRWSTRSFGAFALSRVRERVPNIQEANDYVGRGWHGTEIGVLPGCDARYRGPCHRNRIIGDTVLYGTAGGVVAVLGRAGRNAGADIPSGVTYVFDQADTFASRLNHEMVRLADLDHEDVEWLSRLLQPHYNRTASAQVRRPGRQFTCGRGKQTAYRQSAPMVMDNRLACSQTIVGPIACTFCLLHRRESAIGIQCRKMW